MPLRVANKHKAKISLSVGAHSAKELQNLHYGVGTARRGRTERAQVVNARPSGEFLGTLAQRAREPDAARPVSNGSGTAPREVAQQVPPPGIERAVASPGHFRSQTLPLAQPTLHDPVQTTWQVAAVQPMLLLEPTVKLQVAPEAQLRLVLFPAVSEQVLPPLQLPLQELPQVPAHSPVGQDTEQLETPGSQPITVEEVPPHAAIAASPIATRIIFTGSSPWLSTHG